MTKKRWCEETGVCFTCWNWIECCTCTDYSPQVEYEDDIEEELGETDVEDELSVE
jgi:hypothetical protein